MSPILEDGRLDLASTTVGGEGGCLFKEFSSLCAGSSLAVAVSALAFNLAAFCSLVKTLILIFFIPFVIWSRSLGVVVGVDNVSALATVD